MRKLISFTLFLTLGGCFTADPYHGIDPIELANRPLVTYDQDEIFGQVKDGNVTLEPETKKLAPR